MNNILLIGAGNIGFRHLQSVLSRKEIKKILIIEPAEKAIEYIKKSINSEDLKRVSFYNNFQQVKSEVDFVDFCIIATPAIDRILMIEETLKFNCKNFIIEKLVAQSKCDYEAMLKLKQNNNLNIWVNCTRRYSPFFNELKSLLKNDHEPITMTCDAGNLGLACGSIHLIDLFVFLTQSSVLEFDKKIRNFKQIDTKRKSIIDFAGDILIKGEDGSELRLNYTDQDFYPDFTLIKNSHRGYMIESVSNSIVGFFRESHWKKQVIESQIHPYVSEITGVVIDQVQQGKEVLLPTLEQSYVSHKVLYEILEYMQPGTTKFNIT